MSNWRIGILGSSTLNRFTSGILAAGFSVRGWQVVPHAEAPCVLAQIHGSPAAETEDRTILSLLGRIFESGQQKVVVLVHRPDEVQHRLPELSRVLERALPGTAVTFLGTTHQYDPFFGPLRRVVIPHGFFEPVSSPGMGHIVVGAHTTWGEMRSVEAACGILKELFSLELDAPVLGYLGGGPDSELDINIIRALIGDVVPVASPLEVHEPLAAYSGPPMLLVNPSKRMPAGIEITFNMQLYHLGDGIRSGESSGSAHTGVSIPVIWEMNGAEELEELSVIKVPYDDPSTWRSSDFQEGARLIAISIMSGRFRHALKKNFSRAREMTPAWVAGQYVQLFTELGRTEWVFH